MSNLLKGTAMGRLGRDPETSYTPNGNTICEFTVAVNTWTTGKKDEEPTWVTITAFGRLAETLTDLAERGALKKGTPIYAQGPIRLRLYTTKQGEPRSELKLYATECLLQGNANA